MHSRPYGRFFVSGMLNGKGGAGCAPQQTQNICITFIQRWLNVFECFVFAGSPLDPPLSSIYIGLHMPTGYATRLLSFTEEAYICLFCET